MLKITFGPSFRLAHLARISNNEFIGETYYRLLLKVQKVQAKDSRRKRIVRGQVAINGLHLGQTAPFTNIEIQQFFNSVSRDT